MAKEYRRIIKSVRFQQSRKLVFPVIFFFLSFLYIYIYIYIYCRFLSTSMLSPLIRKSFEFNPPPSIEGFGSLKKFQELRTEIPLSFNSIRPAIS